MHRTKSTFLFILLTAPITLDAEDLPTVLDDRFSIELFAAAPDIVTPTGACIDSSDRLLVVECHTHFRPDDYEGPATDRIRIIEDTDGDGRADRFRSFYEGGEATMSITAGPAGWVYVATRDKVFRIRDTDGDDRADEMQPIVQLETEGEYPHNGLSGLALDRRGGLYFGMGENLGHDYRMIARGDAVARGSGEGGIFHTSLDGTQIRRIATGFWNPFGICVDPLGRVFAVGNDPDTATPSRLVQIVETGDYGFQYRYTRSGIHPLQAWNGQLPGTLPMVAGVSDAPCEILIYAGKLYVASWADHRIERYGLVPIGASFHARREVVVQGDESFRPVGLAQARDGSIYITDWVDKSYPVHGRGRIWCLKPVSTLLGEATPLSGPEQQARDAMSNADWDAAKSDDVFFRQHVVAGLARQDTNLLIAKFGELEDPRQRLVCLQALRWRMDQSLATPIASPVRLIRSGLNDPNPDVRLHALRWVADARLSELRNEVEQLLSGVGLTPAIFQAAIATLELLDTGETTFDAKHTSHYFARYLKDPTHSAATRAIALRMIPPDEESVGLEFLTSLIGQSDGQLRREAVRSLALKTRSPQRDMALRTIAANPELPQPVRDDALMSIAAGQSATRPHGSLPPTDDLAAWIVALGAGGDANAGWRVFFGNRNARCVSCHRVLGRGASTGPDLTGIVTNTSREKVLRSILDPSCDISPTYIPTIVQTLDGNVFTGLWHGHTMDGRREVFQNADGKLIEVSPDEIELRKPSRTSIMPDGIHEQLSIEDIRNLLALLGSQL